LLRLGFMESKGEQAAYFRYSFIVSSCPQV
jgi:hypothetical protein